MGIEKITSKINGDAQREAGAIREKARAESHKIIEAAQAEAEKIRTAADHNGRLEKTKVIRQKKAVADIDSRKVVLEKKQEILDNCFKAAIQKVINMDRDEYINFLVGIVKQSGISEGELILNKRDRDYVGEDLVKELSGSWKLSEETRNFAGGIILKQGDIYINGTVESFAGEIKSEVEIPVAELLFG